MTNLLEQNINLSNNEIWVILECKIDITSAIYNKAINQAKEKALHTMNASQSGSYRSPEMKFQRQFMGCLAEIYVQEYLKKIFIDNNLENDWKVIRYDDVRTDGFKSAENEYDIKVVNCHTSETFLVESRSSIIKDRSLLKGIEQFDIIGNYVSSVKSNEKLNDFYVRPLYLNKDYEKIKYSDLNFEKLVSSNSILLYIVGGCSKSDMITKGYNKSMLQGGTNYRVVKILNGFDSNKFQFEFLKIINKK